MIKRVLHFSEIEVLKSKFEPLSEPNDKPLFIEGADAYDLLCPVSSVTGCRENPLQLLKTLLNDPSKSRALDSILAELPMVNSSVDGLSNDVILDSLQSVFEKGTFFEDDKFAERLMSISSDLLKTVGIDKPISEVSRVAPEPSPEVAPE